MNQAITIIDTKAGNLFSLKASLERIGRTAIIAQTPDDIQGDQLVIPGQGHFGSVMKNLSINGWLNFLNHWRENNKPLLGICVGMQIFFEASEEAPGTSGLGWFKGTAQKLNFPKQPMVGWAKIQSTELPEGIPYFVNSYAIRESEQCIATTNYGETFCAAVKDNNVVGFQFHPEKSSQYGQSLMASVLNNG
ncbi:imidazole glycerol phosphate synthase subunit HisH [Pleionea sediminis]|uniref:imidazole glycerol phosphate synthase subunit HisH n=1 Tax=Pleionea sediminis TaxID=2569479 RepID=UPI001186EA98|nr:imidazole glycerol phosphate synthase subunit HisH [Pleionea sediminis]